MQAWVTQARQRWGGCVARRQMPSAANHIEGKPISTRGTIHTHKHNTTSQPRKTQQRIIRQHQHKQDISGKCRLQPRSTHNGSPQASRMELRSGRVAGQGSLRRHRHRHQDDARQCEGTRTASPCRVTCVQPCSSSGILSRGAKHANLSFKLKGGAEWCGGLRLGCLL